MLLLAGSIGLSLYLSVVSRCRQAIGRAAPGKQTYVLRRPQSPGLRASRHPLARRWRPASRPRQSWCVGTRFWRLSRVARGIRQRSFAVPSGLLPCWHWFGYLRPPQQPAQQQDRTLIHSKCPSHVCYSSSRMHYKVVECPVYVPLYERELTACDARCLQCATERSKRRRYCLSMLDVSDNHLYTCKHGLPCRRWSPPRWSSRDRLDKTMC